MSYTVWFIAEVHCVLSPGGVIGRVVRSDECANRPCTYDLRPWCNLETGHVYSNTCIKEIAECESVHEVFLLSRCSFVNHFLHKKTVSLHFKNNALNGRFHQCLWVAPYIYVTFVVGICTKPWTLWHRVISDILIKMQLLSFKEN